MTALNSLCIVGIFTVAGFGVSYAGIIGWKRYISPAIERRRRLREYKMFFNHIQRDHGSIYGLKRAPNETPAQYTERILLAANDVRHFIPSMSERTPKLDVD